MIYIKNTQKKIPLDIQNIQKDVATILALLGYADFDLNVWFTTDRTIQKYNFIFRSTNKVTDVLSFPYHSHIKPGVPIVVNSDYDRCLGDIMVAPTYVQHHLALWNRTFEEHIRALLVHSICHLIGYDHEDDADYIRMQQKEDEILNALRT
jgi:probable rRNA maturation factor